MPKVNIEKLKVMLTKSQDGIAKQIKAVDS